MSTLFGKLKSLRSILAHLPKREVAAFLYEVSLRMPNWVFKFNRGYILSSNSPCLPTRPSPRFVFGKAQLSDLTEISEFSEVDESVLRQRIIGGDWGYVTRDSENGNRIVTVQWIHVGACYVRGYGLHLDVGDSVAYIYGALSAKEIRLLGAFNSAFKNVCEILKESNVSEIIGLVEFFNHSAYRYHLRSNFTDIATVTFVKVLGIKWNAWKDSSGGRRRSCIFLRSPKGVVTI